MDKISAKELREKLKSLRSEHAGKAIGKMSADEMSREISHHETACKATAVNAKRMEALAKAREARMGKASASKAPVKEVKEKKEKKEKRIVYVSDSDSESSVEYRKKSQKDTSTIGDRIQKKKIPKDE